MEIAGESVGADRCVGPETVLHGAGRRSGTNGDRCENGPCQRGGTEPAPYQGAGAGRCVHGGGVWSPRPTEATLVVPSEGPMYLRHGLRRPNSETKFGASVKSSVPTEGLPESQQRADVGIGPYGWLQRAAVTSRGSALSAGIAAGQIQSLPDK